MIDASAAACEAAVSDGESDGSHRSDAARQLRKDAAIQCDAAHHEMRMPQGQAKRMYSVREKRAGVREWFGSSCSFILRFACKSRRAQRPRSCAKMKHGCVRTARGAPIGARRGSGREPRLRRLHARALQIASDP